MGHADKQWELDWASVYSARALTLPNYVHGRILYFSVDGSVDAAILDCVQKYQRTGLPLRLIIAAPKQTDKAALDLPFIHDAEHHLANSYGIQTAGGAYFALNTWVMRHNLNS